ncbi:MAG: cytochrome c [Bacteroidia bacterium]|nr:cytochrome c [Bacteroidia bacterium]
MRAVRFVVLMGLLWGQDASELGERLFNQRCATCHKLQQKLIGPPLARIGERRSEEWFARFVSNSQALIQSGDTQAVAVFRAYNQQIMPPFPDLTDEDIRALWTYLNSIAAPQPVAESAPSEAKAVLYPGELRPMKVEDFAFLRRAYWLLAAVAVLVALLLAVVIHFVSVKRASEEQA